MAPPPHHHHHHHHPPTQSSPVVRRRRRRVLPHKRLRICIQTRVRDGFRVKLSLKRTRQSPFPTSPWLCGCGEAHLVLLGGAQLGGRRLGQVPQSLDRRLGLLQQLRRGEYGWSVPALLHCYIDSRCAATLPGAQSLCCFTAGSSTRNDDKGHPERQQELPCC